MVIKEIKEGKEEELLAQNAQIEVKNKKKRTAQKLKRAIAIVTLIIAACVVSLIVSFTVIIPKLKYNKAMTLLESGEYESAYALLEELGKNDDITSNKYDRAMALIDSGDYEQACILLKDLNYKDSIDKLESIKTQYERNLLSKAKIGDYIVFGSYEQDNDTTNGKEDIEWLVLAKIDNKLLVISRYALDRQKYNTSASDCTWETCSLRKWLNDQFINSAFNSNEQTMIMLTTVTADKNPRYNTSPGKSTTDKVFLLSITEANKYFSSNKARQCQGTAYCYARGAYRIPRNGNCWWWLRSPGKYPEFAALDYDDGSVYINGTVVDDWYEAVRPVMWIDFGL